MKYKNNVNYKITFTDIGGEVKTLNLKGNRVEDFLIKLDRCGIYDAEVTCKANKNTLEMLVNKLDECDLIYGGNKNCEFIKVPFIKVNLEIKCDDGIYYVVIYDKTNEEPEYDRIKTYKTLNGLIKWIRTLE